MKYISHSAFAGGITNSAVELVKVCVEVPIPKNPLTVKLFAGAVVPAKVPKAADPLQSKVLVPKKLLLFPSVKDCVVEEAGIFNEFAIFAILTACVTCYKCLLKNTPVSRGVKYYEIIKKNISSAIYKKCNLYRDNSVLCVLVIIQL